MTTTPLLRRPGVLATAIAVVLFAALIVWDPGAGTTADPLAGEGDVAAGEAAFRGSCAECHGAEAIGTDQGPPLVHTYYRPGHHADGAFFAAVRLGVREHHWTFGNMPVQEGLTDEDINNIVAYVRYLQVEAGIE